MQTGAATELVAAPASTGSVRLDEVTAGLLDSSFDVAGDHDGLFLRGLRPAVEEVRTTLGPVDPVAPRFVLTRTVPSGASSEVSACPGAGTEAKTDVVPSGTGSEALAGTRVSASALLTRARDRKRLTGQGRTMPATFAAGGDSPADFNRPAVCDGSQPDPQAGRVTGLPLGFGPAPRWAYEPANTSLVPAGQPAIAPVDETPPPKETLSPAFASSLSSL